MDSSKKYDNPSPEAKANIISRVLFFWILPFFKYGYNREIEIKDIYNCTDPDLSGPLGDELERNWDEQVIKAKKNKTKPSLLKAISKTFIRSYSIQGILTLIQCIVVRMAQPIVLAAFIRYFGDPTRLEHTHRGWLLASGVVVLSIANILLMHWTSLCCQRIGMRCRIACCSLIYRKLLKLNNTSLGETAVGQLVNLLSNDVNRFDFASIFLHFIWIMPIQMVVAAYIMYDSVGLASIAGLSAAFIQAVPLQGFLAKRQGVLRNKIAIKTDGRVKLMNEITAGIQVIKMYAWEKPFEKMVELARRLEIRVLSKTSYIKGFSVSLYVFTERATLYLTLVTYVLLGNTLTGDVVFSMAQLFNTVQLYMAILFPLGLASYAEAKTSVRRIEDYLSKEENVTDTPKVIEPKVNKGLIKLSYANACWVPNSIVDTLIDVNLEIQPGTFCCIVGPIGAGKSSLLQLLLRELPISTGKMTIEGDISYASQEPWLFVSNVRNNILFGQPYDRKRYNEVVKVCALERDFELFPYGDKTLVGERGVSLSGGQRARINLARAVYRQTDIYLFDDPLSAVDTHVGKQLLEQCVVKHLKSKTRLLVTHQLQFLKQADLVVIINNGRVEKVCKYNELSEEELKALQQEKSDPDVAKQTECTPNRDRLKSISSINSTKDDEDEMEEPQESQELMEKGALSSSIYWKYYRAGGSVFLLLFLLFLFVIAQAATNCSDLWVTYWTNSVAKTLNKTHDVGSTTVSSVFDNMNLSSNILDDALNGTNDIVPTNKTDFVLSDDSVMFKLWPQETYILIYTLFIILSMILTTLRSLVFYKVCMKASTNLHNLMFKNVLQATMRFFDTNPSGRILNRFSKDMGAVDELLPYATIQAIQIFLVAIGILIMVFIVSPIMIIATVALGIIFYWTRVVFLKSAQNVKRLEGVLRAPVFSHISASLNGLPTIRSCNAQVMVTKEFDALQDQHTGSWYLFIAGYEAFGFYLDVISIVFLMCVSFQFLIFDSEHTLGGNVGLVISQSLIIMGMLQFGVRQTADVASHMTSVERVLMYTKLDKEGPFESLPANKPKPDWPPQGHILFKNVYLRYSAEEEPVLKNLNIDIAPGEKIGIVGRTGAGKSSLISALFRLTPTDGDLSIDGVDIKTIGLNDLRSNISIIPQEPVLFSASVRYNLDPFEKCSDETLWKALENVELKEAIESLSQKVSEGGSNFSAGQRQLMCLARAIVRNNRVLVMDEATANVDPQTDALIQTTIRKNFKDCTVLTVAHRLNTIMDSDKVMVMDAGQMVEFAHPYELLQQNRGFLYGMVKDTGPMMEAKLRKVAMDDYKAKFGSTGKLNGFSESVDSSEVVQNGENTDENTSNVVPRTKNDQHEQ